MPTKLTTTEYGSLMAFLAHIRSGKDLEEIANRFVPESLVRVLSAVNKIQVTIQAELDSYDEQGPTND